MGRHRRQKWRDWIEQKQVLLGSIFIVGQAVVFSLLPVWI